MSDDGTFLTSTQVRRGRWASGGSAVPADPPERLARVQPGPDRSLGERVVAGVRDVVVSPQCIQRIEDGLMQATHVDQDVPLCQDFAPRRSKPFQVIQHAA